MQFNNSLKSKFQETKKGSSPQSPEQGFLLTQNKPPLVESRSSWNKNVYIVPKWEKRDIKHVDNNNHTPFPIRNYINYVQLHSEGFKNSLNLDFLKHIIRHFAVNQWWIDQTKKFKRTIPINILQSSDNIQQNNQICKLLIQKSFDDLNFYNEILLHAKIPSMPSLENQLNEYKSSVTYQLLDLNSTDKFKNESLFQLQDIFIKRIIQLLQDHGLSSLGYYDYLTFQKIVEDQKQGICDAQTFLKVLEIKRLFNQINLISQQNELITNQWKEENQKRMPETLQKFRRWNQEKSLLSDEILDLANYVGLDVNLKKARKNYELNKTEQQFNELVIIGDQISTNAQKIILDTETKLSKCEKQDSQSIGQIQNTSFKHSMQIALNKQKKVINQQDVQQKDEGYLLKDQNIININTGSSDNLLNIQVERFDNEKQKSQENQISNNIQKQIKRQVDTFHSPQKQSLDRFQLQNQNQLNKLSRTQRINFNTSPSKRVIIISDNNHNSQNSYQNQQQYRKFHQSSNERSLMSKLDINSNRQERNLISQLSQRSLRSYEDFINPIEPENISQNQNSQLHNFHTQNQIKQNVSNHQNRQAQIITSYNSISLHKDRKNGNNQNDVQLVKEFIKNNKKYQLELQNKLFKKDIEKLEREDQVEIQNNSNSNYQIDIHQVDESQELSDDVDQLRSLTQKETRSYDPNILNQESDIHNSLPESISNNTTARTLKNTSNYNSNHQKKLKLENQEDFINDKSEQLQTINEISKKISPVLIRQTSIKNSKKIVDQKQQQKPIKDLQLEKQQNQVNFVHSQIQEVTLNQDIKHDELSNNNYSQKSIDLPSLRTRNTLGITEKSKSSLKSSTHYSEQNKQIMKENQKGETTIKSQENQQENKKSKNKFVNREFINDPLEDESEEDSDESENDETEQINNPIGYQKKQKKKKKFSSLSTSKQERIEDHKRYLQSLKEELKEMLAKQVNLKEIKEHINIILSEIGGINLDQDLNYYIQLYKSRVQELSYVNQESHEIRFQNQQPVCELRLKREIKGLKFARDCDRITKLKPVDFEDIIDTQRLIQIEEELKDQDYTAYQYQPQFRYEQRPSPLQTDIIQVSLDVTRSQTPNKRRIYRTNPRFESDFNITRQQKKTLSGNKKRQKQKKQAYPIMIKKDPLNNNFPYLHKYKPELLKTILEARISLEQLI